LATEADLLIVGQPFAQRLCVEDHNKGVVSSGRPAEARQFFY